MKLFTYNEKNTRQKIYFYVDYKGTKLKSFSISCHGVSLYNSLDIEIRALKCIDMLKVKFKNIFSVVIQPYNALLSIVTDTECHKS